MAYTDDVSTDYLYWDNTEAVTVGFQAGNVSVATAKRNDVKQQSSNFGGVNIQHADLVWLIPVALCSGNELKEGDTITDASSVVYTADSVDKVGNGSSFSHFVAACNKGR